jgi:4-diphosphocytidyl-2-C-methyl-D-erythritol kinase
MMAAITIEVQCPAKVNLTFDIKGLLPDGYHEVETLLQAVSLYDRLRFDFYPDERFEINIKADPRLQAFPLDERNIIHQSVAAFYKHLRRDFRLDVAVDKTIPMGAGLGGGSSNAAATLMALNAAFDEPFELNELIAMGRELGADVPFFMLGGSCLGTGRGDLLEPLNQLLKLWFVLVKPRSISIQTKWAYEEFDKYIHKNNLTKSPKPDWRAAVNTLQADKLGNVLELPVFAHYPALAELKHAVESAGAICCHMTGSGSALYGLASTEKQAQLIADKLSLNVEAALVDIFVAESISGGIRLGNDSEIQNQTSIA